MKKYLFLAVAALGLAACAEKGLDNGPVQNGELEQSYVAITLAADDMNTKADDRHYEAGLEAERVVKSAYVFFFKDGKPFYVSFDGTTSTNVGPNNYLSVNLTNADEQNGMQNVSDIKNSVLVLQNYKGEYPNQVVAVLNWVPTKSEYKLAELQNEVADLKAYQEGFVMSNAVYADGAKETVDAVDLTVANIGKTEEEAEANPVTIHVERVAAKVAFSANAVDGNTGKFKVGEVDGEDIYAQIKGFQLYNDYQSSWLLKKITPTWGETELGFGWNDAAWFRSYWGTSLNTAFPDNAFMWADAEDIKLNNFDYCGENTRPWSKENDVRTKVIVKAQLVSENGYNTKEVVNWYGKDYIGEGKLRTVVANTLKNTYFSFDGSAYIGITKDDLNCVARKPQEENAYEVYFQLSEVSADNGVNKDWYKYENGNYTAISDDALNVELAEVQPALVYKNGMTYYYTDIKHLGNTGTTAEYGVVRNHVYRVNITDIKGFGTPVYDPSIDFVTPDKPDNIVTYVSAQINILSWRVVENNYELN